MLRLLVARPSRTVSIALAVAAILLGSNGSEARPRKSPRTAVWQPGFSTIVVDAKTGHVIQADRPDELRHPASLAKVMTLYLLFEEIEVGRLRLTSRIKVSAEAASQPPSKLGLKPNETISVDDAIKAVVTRSANDVAVAIAEAIAGDEASFARLMTRKARALGMSRTIYRNASGLPDSAQVTTAREQALLALALQDRFPKLYSYFSTRVFQWRGVEIGNHNKLLGRVDGVDGIKTGYTRASGFNLVTNVKRGERHIVAVVLGGRSGAARDAIMRDLIAENIRHASTGPRTAPRYAEARSVPVPRPQPGSTEPIRPTPVPVVPFRQGDRPAPKPGTLGVLAVSALDSSSHPMPITPPRGAGAEPERASAGGNPAAASTVSASQAAFAVSSSDEMPTASAGGWLIQIGAFHKESEAREHLASARAKAPAVLSGVRPYTERTVRGKTEYIRARFAGFDEPGAKRACETLKKNGFACIVMQN